jgi:hypothetical protein
MPFPTTGSNTELQAVNQILASVGQAPVTTLTTEETLVINEVESLSLVLSLVQLLPLKLLTFLLVLTLVVRVWLVEPLLYSLV